MSAERQLRKSKDPSKRVSAAEELGARGDPRAFEPLTAALQDQFPRVRAAAARALGKLGDQRAVPPLTAALADRDLLEVGHAAGEALWTLGGLQPLTMALMNQDGNASGAARRALRDLGDERAVDPLIAVLRDGNKFARMDAAELLGKLGGERAVEPLIAALGDEHISARIAAARALGEIGDARAVEPLIAALGDEDPRQRETAAHALSKFGDARAVEPLIAQLEGEPFTMRAQAAWCLGEIGDARAVEPLIAIVRDKAGANRANNVPQSAARALGALGDRRAVEPLTEALADHTEGFRAAAAEALGKLGWQPGDGPQRARLALATQDWDQLAGLGPAAVGPLVAALQTPAFFGKRALGEKLWNTLLGILNGGLAGIETDVLRQVAALDDVEWSLVSDACGYMGTYKWTVSCADVRQLARQELIGRGLTA